MNAPTIAPTPKSAVQRPEGTRIRRPMTSSTMASALQCGLRAADVAASAAVCGSSATAPHAEGRIDQRSADCDRNRAEYQCLQENAEAFAGGACEHVIQRADPENTRTKAGWDQN